MLIFSPTVPALCAYASALASCVCVCQSRGPCLCQVVFPDNRITILSLFTVSEPVGWIKDCMVDSAGGTSRRELQKM